MPTELTEGEDYYVENGRWVFTAAFLRRRGYCCGSGCRHCPYRTEKWNAEEGNQCGPPARRASEG